MKIALKREIIIIKGFAGRLKDEIKARDFTRKLWARFVILWTLLTRIPIPKKWYPAMLFSVPDVLVLSPLVGGLLGLVATFPAFLIGLAIHPTAAAWIACAIYTLVGWSLNLNGWGKMWNTMAPEGGRDKGYFAMAGVLIAIATRASLLSVINISQWLSVCIAAGGVGRFAGSVAACLGERSMYVSREGSPVPRFGGYQLFCSFIVALFLFPFAPAGWLFGMLAASLCAAGMALWSNKSMGGINKDILDAASILGEILVLIGCAL